MVYNIVYYTCSRIYIFAAYYIVHSTITVLFRLETIAGLRRSRDNTIVSNENHNRFKEISGEQQIKIKINNDIRIE